MVMNTPQMSTGASTSVDRIIEASQDWWVKDQSALAFGLENWDDPWDTVADAVGMGFETELPGTTTSSSSTTAMENSGHDFVTGSLAGNHDIGGGAANGAAASTMGLNLNIPMTLPGYDADFLAESQIPSSRGQPTVGLNVGGGNNQGMSRLHSTKRDNRGSFYRDRMG